MEPALYRPFALVATLLLGAALAACDDPDSGFDGDVWVGPPGDTDLDVGYDTTDTTDASDASDAGGDVSPDAGDVSGGAVPTLNVAITEARLAELHRDPQARLELPCEVDWDGVRYDDVEIEIHGGFARTVPKLSYRLKFDDDAPWRTDVFGEGDESHRRVVLQASWIDPSYARNCLTMDLVRDIGGIAPRCQYVELTFNDRYQGLYLAIERVDAEFLARNGLAEDGLVLKASHHAANWADKADPIDGFEIKINDEAPTAGMARLLETLADTPLDYDAFEVAVAAVLDLDDFTGWQMAHTLADNRDTFTKNYYLHYDWRADTPFRIISWDADATWGINWDGATVDPSTQDRLWGNDAFSPRLFAIPEYVAPYVSWYAEQVVAARQEELRDNLAERVARIAPAARRDLAAWERGVSFSEEVERLEDAIDTRFEVMRGAVEAAAPSEER